MSTERFPDEPTTRPGMTWMPVELKDIETDRDTEIRPHPAVDAWQDWLDSLEH